MTQENELAARKDYDQCWHFLMLPKWENHVPNLHIAYLYGYEVPNICFTTDNVKAALPWKKIWGTL